MAKKPEIPNIRADEVKKWAGNVVHAAKTTIDEVVENIKEGSVDFSRKQLEAKRKKDLLLLRPVFKETLTPSADSAPSEATKAFAMPDIIHVVEKDKQHANSEVCNHSLGHLSTENGVSVLNVYPHHMKDLGVVFYPDMKREVYYADPFQKNLYIDIREYFNKLKKARVAELERLAYSLGATHFEILFSTNNSELEKAKKKAELGVKKGKKKLVDVKAEHAESEAKKESMEMASSSNFSGHNDPQVPELIYFRDDPDIQNLIHMRIDKKSELENKEYRIKYGDSCGIKESDAVKIQGALDKIGGGSAGVSIANEALSENYTTLIYRIEFKPYK